MRAAIGLVGLLVAMGIIILLMRMGMHPADTVRRAEPAKRQAERLAGVDEEGVRASDSIRLEPVLIDGKVRYVLVDSIMSRGPMEKHYGLQRGDAIIQAGDMAMKDLDGELAKAMILQAYQMNWKLIVLRNEQKLVLPMEQPPPAGQNDTALQRQVERINTPHPPQPE